MLLLKMALPALIIGIVSLIADRHPSLGGYVAMLPVVTLTSLGLLIAERSTSATVSNFLIGALTSLSLSSVMLLATLLLVRGGVPLGNAMLLGGVVWLLLTFLGLALLRTADPIVNAPDPGRIEERVETARSVGVELPF